MTKERPSLRAQFAQEAQASSATTRKDYWNPTLNIRFVEGHNVAFLYSHLQWMNFDPRLGIMLHFSTHTVSIEGRNLGVLYDELLELKLRNISVEEHDEGEPDTTVVTKVRTEQVKSVDTSKSKKSKNRH